MPTGFHFVRGRRTRALPAQTAPSLLRAAPRTPALPVGCLSPPVLWPQYTPDELLYNAKLHIDEDHKAFRPRVPKHLLAKKDEL